MGLGDTARRFEGAFGVGAGEAVSRLSVDDLFIDAYGLVCRRLPFGFGDNPPAFCISRAAAAGFGAPAAAYAVKGFLNVFAFCGVCLTACPLFCLDTLPEPFCCVMGLPLRFHGWKSSLRSSTKFEGKRPTMRLSRFNRPIHHDPSPALRHSIRSPSMKPRSRLVWKERLGWLYAITVSSVSTYLTAPRVDGFAPAWEANRQRLGSWRHPQSRLCVRFRMCRFNIHPAGVRGQGDIRLFEQREDAPGRAATRKTARARGGGSA